MFGEKFCQKYFNLVQTRTVRVNQNFLSIYNNSPHPQVHVRKFFRTSESMPTNTFVVNTRKGLARKKIENSKNQTDNRESPSHERIFDLASIYSKRHYILRCLFFAAIAYYVYLTYKESGGGFLY